LLKEIAELTSAKESLDSQIVKLREDMELAIRERDEKAEKYLREIDTVKEEMNQRIHDNLVKYEEEARALEKECNDIIEANNSQMKEVREQCKRDVDAADEERKKAEEKYEELSAAHEKLTEEKTLCEARLKGVRAQHGLMTDDDDYTEEDTFSILEKEHEAFERFYNSQWDKTKKKIRKSILNMENLTGRKRHK
jgi:hypothetical protein